MAGNKKRKKSRKKHCNSKREVFQMVQDHINEKHPQQSRNIMAQKLQTINRLKPVLQATRENMRKQEGSRNGTDISSSLGNSQSDCWVNIISCDSWRNTSNASGNT